MQVQGSLPYRMSATREPPTFCLPLLLWSVFTFIMQVALMYTVGDVSIFQYASPEVGSIVFTVSAILMISVVCMTPVALAVRSGMLARLLHDMSKITEVAPPPSYYWYCKPKTLLLIFAGMITHVFSVFSFIGMGFTTTMIVIFMPFALLTEMNLFVPGGVSFMVFGLLGHRLVAATEATVARISILLAHDGSFKREKDVQTAMLALQDLDAVIREV